MDGCRRETMCHLQHKAIPKIKQGGGGMLPLLTLIPHDFRAHTSRQTQPRLNKEASLKMMHWNIPEDWKSKLWSLNAKCVICWKVDTVSALSWCVFHLFEPLYIFISFLQTEKANLGIYSAGFSFCPYFFLLLQWHNSSSLIMTQTISLLLQKHLHHLLPPTKAMHVHLWEGTQLPCRLRQEPTSLRTAVIKLSPVTLEHPVLLLQLTGWEEESAEKSIVRRKQEENHLIDFLTTLFFFFLF